MEVHHKINLDVPTCKHCGAPIVSYGNIWRHARDPDHEVWCGQDKEFRVEPSL